MKQEKIKQESRRNFIKVISAASALAYMPVAFGQKQGSEITSISDDPEEGRFLEACQNGDLALVKTMVTANPKLLETKDRIGRTGFAIALLNEHKNIGDYLKESGYQTDLHETVLDLNWKRYEELIGEETEKTVEQINAGHPVGGTVMWAAARAGAGSDMWRVYGKCGDPNSNPQATEGSTPLQQALQYSNLKIAEITAAALLSNQANPNPVTNAEMPPLHLAAQRGSIEMAEMLVRLGADVNTKNKNGKNAAQTAEYYGHESLAQLLIDHEKIPRTCHSSRTAFNMDGNPYKKANMDNIPLYKQGKLVGFAHRNLEELKKMVKSNPDMVHSVATTSEICVEAGAHVGRKDIVEFLIKKGAPYSLPTAVMMNDFKSVQRMLEEDPNRIHERGAHDFPLLWYPVIGGNNIEMMQLLLKSGAKVEEQHFLGTTALHWACFKESIEMIELLVENGANVNRSGRKFSPEGETPLQSSSDEKITNYLISKGAK